jgi:hypothetical protein
MKKYILVVLITHSMVLGCRAQTRQTDTVTVSNTQIPVGKEPTAVEIADLNNDGHFDLVVANFGDNSATILLGDGKGGFTPSKGSPIPSGPSPNDIAIADFNNDKNLDIAFANHEQKYLTVLLGDGKGGFAPASKSPFAVNVKPHTHGIAAADFNDDGNSDLVTDSWGTDQIDVLFGDGKGSFTTPGKLLAVGKHPYQRVRTADVNGDGKADIITTNLEGDNVTILLGDDKGNFKQADGSPFSCGDSPFNFAVGDLNGDSKPDLAIVNSPSSTSDRQGKDGLTILIGDGTGKFNALAGSPFAVGKTPNLAAIGDIDGDKINDVVVSAPDENQITLFRMSYKGLVSSSTLTINGNPKGLAIRDLNGDGKGDIVMTLADHNSVLIVSGK